MSNVRNFVYQVLLYVTNHLVNKAPSHFFRLGWYRKIWRLAVGTRSYIFLGTTFDSRGNFTLGNGSVINQNCRMDNRGGITIGRNVSISAEVVVLTADHDPNSPTFEGRTHPVVIHNYAFVGTRAMILPGVTVGKGAVVAAGAVVTKDVQPFTIVAGIPAKVIGSRTTQLDYNLDYGRLFF